MTWADDIKRSRCVIGLLLYKFDTFSLTLPAYTDKTYLMSKPWISCLVSTNLIYLTTVTRMQLQMFLQHLKAAPAFVSAYLLRLQCQSAGSLKTQECIISRGYSCGPRGFNSITILSIHLFFSHFPSDILPITTNEEIVALNLTYFLMFSLIDVTFTNQPLDWTNYQYSKQTTRMITSSIFKCLTWVPQHLLILRFSLYLNI